MRATAPPVARAVAGAPSYRLTGIRGFLDVPIVDQPIAMGLIVDRWAGGTAMEQGGSRSAASLAGASSSSGGRSDSNVTCGSARRCGSDPASRGHPWLTRPGVHWSPVPRLGHCLDPAHSRIPRRGPLGERESRLGRAQLDSGPRDLRVPTRRVRRVQGPPDAWPRPAG